MIWLSAWSWAGALGVVLPVLIHLLGRGHARPHRFPTLRFLETSRLLPTRRSRIRDALLLAIRCGTIVLAAAALAGPLLLTSHRRRTLDRGLARAIIVDTSESMRRYTPSGGPAVDSARHEARTLAGAAQTSITIESNDPASALLSASAWLTTQRRRAELVVISDFQRGAIDSSDFSVVASGVGVTLRRVPIVAPAVLEAPASIEGVLVVARTIRAGEQTDATWAQEGAAPANDALVLLGATEDAAALSATRNAAATIATPLPTSRSRAIAVVFPQYPDRSALQAAVQQAYAPWMLDLLATLQADSIRVTASGVANAGGRQRLIIFSDSKPGSLTSARLAAIANAAMSIAPPAAELEPETLSDATLAALQRPSLAHGSSDMDPSDGNGPSDGRWLWIGVLALMLLEVPLRRSRGAASAAEPKERVRAA